MWVETALAAAFFSFCTDEGEFTVGTPKTGAITLDHGSAGALYLQLSCFMQGSADAGN